MKYIFLSLIFVSLNCFKAQQTAIDSLKIQCEYSLHYQTDSTDIRSKDNENFLLFIGKNKSLFLSTNKYKRDSIKNSYIKQSSIKMLDLTNFPKTAFPYKIVKDYVNNNILFYDDISAKLSVYYTEKPNLIWKISDETDKIANIDCNIAYTNYAGRVYKAWYATNILLPEGPYKFNGLPGLITKIEDTKGYYKFELISIKDLSGYKKTIDMENNHINGKKITKKEYLNAKKNYIDNLGEELRNSGIFIGADAIKKAQDRAKKKNNPIELKVD
ncbi:GLPGLI family protein [Riemerella anatipestifer]|uniref:GLPGLI family protein n=1 Tax=Riemerella anatipestifer TaxID=34085 RepID=UPI0022658451|nr:GLPGLI family protein [Riemerella anatipestifer]UZX28573.1 GLPGLI family protein [Riemerella anatipestifer]